MKSRSLRFLNSCFLILGTSIGVGMLGMPVEMGAGGALPCSSFLILSWAISLITGLFFLEAMCKVKSQMNFASLAERFIGASSKIFIILIYLILFLSLLFAYVKGGGVFVADLSKHIPPALGTVVFLLFFLPWILKGPKAIGKINSLLVLVMFLAFILLLSLGFKDVQATNLAHQDWKASFLSFPLLVTAYGFHIIIPSLYTYLDGNKKLIRIAIIIGTTTTLFLYLLWNSYIMGVVPLIGEFSLQAASQLDQTAISPLKRILGPSQISMYAQIFYFCALTTSFLGVSLSTIDFSLDALNLKNTLKNRTQIIGFVFIPALLFSITSLRIFYLSIKFGAAIACTLLLIIFPAFLMIKMFPRSDGSRGNNLKKSVGFALAFASLVFVAQILNFL